MSRAGARPPAGFDAALVNLAAAVAILPADPLVVCAGTEVVGLDPSATSAWSLAGVPAAEP